MAHLSSLWVPSVSIYALSIGVRLSQCIATGSGCPSEFRYVLWHILRRPSLRSLHVLTNPAVIILMCTDIRIEIVNHNFMIIRVIGMGTDHVLN